MTNAKKGLRLLSFSLILNIGWAIASSILQNKSVDLPSFLASFLTYSLITSIIITVCYVIDLIGLHIAGKDSIHFHRASFLKIASIVLAVVCTILGIVAVQNKSAAQGLNTAVNVINIVSAVAEVIVLTSVIKGCKEISPRVSGMANFVYVCFIFQVIFMVALPFIASAAITTNPSGEAVVDGTLAVVILALTIVYLIAAVLYTIFYVILIFRATAHAGKTR